MKTRTMVGIEYFFNLGLNSHALLTSFFFLEIPYIYRILKCCKKHSYVCPLFEATGKCPQGSKCKLHHPKSRNKSKKRKCCEIQSNSRGRYFGSKIIKLGESLSVNSDKCAMEKVTDPLCYDGRFADFISIDAASDDNDGIDTNAPKETQTKESDSDPSDMHPDELDALIKPVRIMKKVNLPIASITC